MISCGVICNVYLRCKQTEAISAVRNSRGTTGYIRWNRAVHHSVILEFDVPSYRTGAAQQRRQAKEVNRQN